MDINTEIFETVVETAKIRTGGDSRWISAIDRAVKMLDGNPYVQLNNDELLVMSDTSLHTYAANGTCQCAAFLYGQPCKHRALKRLLQLYYEAVAQSEAQADRDGRVEIAVLLDGPLPQLHSSVVRDSRGNAPRGGRGAALRASSLPITRTILPNGRVIEKVRGIQI